MVQLSATRCSCITILCVSPVGFAAITPCVASQRVFIVVYFFMTQSGNFWIQPRMKKLRALFFRYVIRKAANTHNWFSCLISK
jgi:hypothetical protein